MRGDSFGSEYKALDTTLLKRLNSFLKPYKSSVFIAVILTLLTSALAPLRPYLTKIAIDKYIVGQDWNGLLIMILIIFASLVLHGLLSFFLTYLMQKVGQYVLYDLRMMVFDKISKSGASFFDKNPVGRLVTRATNDVESLNQLFSQGVIMIFADILLILWIVGFMFYTNVQLALLTLSILPGLLIATSIFRKKVRVLFRDLRKETATMNSFMNEFFTGINTIKLFAQEKRLIFKLDESNKETRTLNVKTIFYYAVFFPVVETLSAIALSLVLWKSAGDVIHGAVTIGAITAFLQYSEMFFRPVRDLSEKYTTLQGAMAGAERIFDLLDDDVLEKQDANAVKLDKFENEIEFKDLTFSYDGQKTVLNNLNLSIKKGEKVAIVGATGSGKTTLIGLLTKFYDGYSGEIKIDGIELSKIDNTSLREKTALVMQDVFLFSRSVADNVALGDGNISEQRLTDSAKALGAFDFINYLPDKFNTQVNERGSGLSSGQRQLISFCRAYAYNPEILILDEATSNIDPETEEIISKSLDNLLLGRTAIIIAHRLSTIKRSDKIAVMHKGELREIGTHEELLEKQGLYSRLYKLQFESMKK